MFKRLFRDKGRLTGGLVDRRSKANRIGKGRKADSADEGEEVPRHYSLLDLGQHSVKAVVVQKVEGGAKMLTYGQAPSRGHSLSGGRAAAVALASIAEDALRLAEDRTPEVCERKIVPDEALLSLPARMTRGRLFSVRHSRPDSKAPVSAPEMNALWERAGKLAREQLNGRDEDGLVWLPLAVNAAGTRIDGHLVTSPVGMKGKELEFSVFGTAILRPARRALDFIAERLELEVVDVIAAPQSLAVLVPAHDAVICDVGDADTTLCMIRHNALTAFRQFGMGGRLFTEGVAESYHCAESSAEVLKERYIGGDLPEADRERIEHALAPLVEKWLGELADRLRGLSDDSPIPPAIYMAGGGSLLPGLLERMPRLESMPQLKFRRTPEASRLVDAARNVEGMPSHPTATLLTTALSLSLCLP